MTNKVCLSTLYLWVEYCIKPFWGLVVTLFDWINSLMGVVITLLLFIKNSTHISQMLLLASSGRNNFKKSVVIINPLTSHYINIYPIFDESRVLSSISSEVAAALGASTQNLIIGPIRFQFEGLSLHSSVVIDDSFDCIVGKTLIEIL